MRALESVVGADRVLVETKIKKIITSLTGSDIWDRVDWANMQIPTAMNQITVKLFETHVEDKGVVSNAWDLGTGNNVPKKRKTFDSIEMKPALSISDRLDPRPIDYTFTHPLSLPKKKKHPMAVFEETAFQLPYQQITVDSQTLQDRLNRFDKPNQERIALKKVNDKLARKANYESVQRGQDGNMDVIDWDCDTIVGTFLGLEKRYLRLTSAPDPSLVRGLATLEKSFSHLTQKWKVDQNYPFICDQFKSLRQDLTVQRIRNNFTVKNHARIALEKGDVGEYNQCQAQLLQLYALGLSGHTEEFLGYRILYMIYTKNSQGPPLIVSLTADLTKTIAALTCPQKTHPNIINALLIHTSLITQNYPKFFRAYADTRDMNAWMVDLFLERVRVGFMQRCCRGFRPRLAIAYLVRGLGFLGREHWQDSEQPIEDITMETTIIISSEDELDKGDLEHTIKLLNQPKYKRARKLCVKWLNGHKVAWVENLGERYSWRDGERDGWIDTKASMGLFVEGWGVDIKGQL